MQSSWMRRGALLSSLLAGTILTAQPVKADWKPNKPIEFIVTSGSGGGTDMFARTVQGIITKYKLIDQAIVVNNKGGGSGAEGYAYGKSQTGDAHKVIFGTNNAYLLPLVVKMAYKSGDLMPVAAMAMDEFLVWVPSTSPYQDISSYLLAVKAKPETFKMGGSQSKDVDQTLTSLIEGVSGTKFIYVPFKGGGEAAVQLAGGHIDSNTNNPSENIGQWKAGLVKPLCVFSTNRLPAGGKITATMGWSDIPTCKENGVNIDQYQMPRTVWLPLNVPADSVAYYVDILKKVKETPDWSEYIERTSQTPVYLTGNEFKSFMADDEKKNKSVFEKEGWIAQ